MSKQMQFYCFIAFCDFPEVPSVKSLVSIKRDRNFYFRVCTDSLFLDLLKFMSFTTAEKMDIPEKQARTQRKIFITKMSKFSQFH